MNEEIKQAIRETSPKVLDASNLATILADRVNAEQKLEYPKDSDSYGVLYKACHDEIWRAKRAEQNWGELSA